MGSSRTAGGQNVVALALALVSTPAVEGTLKMREWKHQEVNEYGKRGLTYVCPVDRTNAALIRQYDFSHSPKIFVSMTF